MKKNILRLSVVFSFRNEEDSLTELITRVSKLKEISFGLDTPHLEFELIFVNDASSDNSLEILLSEQEKSSDEIVVINMSRRFGVGPCVLAGLECATGDVVVYMDSDLQDPPELIPSMIQEYLKGFDVVHMRRRTRAGESALKLFLTRAAYRVINKLSEIEMPVDVGDFKLLSKRVVNEILKVKDSDPYIRGLAPWAGFKQTVLYYDREARKYGSTKFQLLGTGPVREFLRAITSFSSIPLYVSIYIGFVSILFSLITIIYATYTKILGLAVPGVTGIIIVVSFFSGLILFTQGLIGLYLSYIFFQVKGRPRYIIESVSRKKPVKQVG